MKAHQGLARWLFLAAFGFALASGAAAAQDYPVRPIRIIVPFPAGAGPDQVARMIAQHLRGALGQTVIVENRAGALGSIGAAEVARSAPDGYTLLMATNTTHAANVAMIRDLPYDPAKDFTPIMRLVTTAMVLIVKPDFPAKDISEFLTYARAHNGALTAGYGSGAAQISIAQLKSRGDIRTVTASYRGVPEALSDVMAGTIDLSFADLSLAVPQIRGGTLRGLGVTARQRSDLLSDLPALAESMPGFEAVIWYGLVAPANTPPAIVERLYKATDAFMDMPATRARLAQIGVQVAPLPPAEFGPFIKAQIQKWTDDAHQAGIEPR